MKKIMISLVIVLLVALVGWRIAQKISAARAGAKPGAGRGAPLAVVVHPILRQPIRDLREFTGTISPKTQFIAAPKIAGRLERLPVRIGQEIRAGDLIAQLDRQEYEQQVEQSRADLDVARANVAEARSALEIAQREWDRARELRKQQVASESELDQAEARYRAALARQEVTLAQVKQKEAALTADEVRLSYTRITAQWEGDPVRSRLVGERFVDEGAMLKANEPIATILDIDTVIASIYVIERDYPFVQTGQTATLTTDAFPDQVFQGVITRKAPLLKESSRQALVEIEVPNPDRRLVPGLFVRASIQFAVHEEAAVIPSSAVVRRNGHNGVFTADLKTRTAHFVPIDTGITEGEWTEISSPAPEGPVITLGQHLLEDGAAIVLPDQPTPAKSRSDRSSTP